MVSSILVLEVSDNPTGKSKKKKSIRIENKDRTTTKKKKETYQVFPGDWEVKTLSFHCRGRWFSPCMSHLTAKTNTEKLYLFTNNVIVWGWLASPEENPQSIPNDLAPVP